MQGFGRDDCHKARGSFTAMMNRLCISLQLVATMRVEAKIKRLIPIDVNINLDDIGDIHYAIAMDIEDSLLASGAVAGEDYNRLDLFKLASPFVRSIFDDPDNKNRIEFSVPTG